MLGNFHVFCRLLIFFSKLSFLKTSLRNISIAIVSNSLKQDQHDILSGLICAQIDDTSKQRVNVMS